MSEVALIDPGAIGGLVAAWLCQDKDHDVKVCARTFIPSLNLDTPYGKIEAYPRVLTKPQQARPVDWAMVATKAYDSESAAHADRQAGRRLEIDLRNGVIVRLGHKHGISTPFNEMAVDVLTSVSPNPA